MSSSMESDVWGAVSGAAKGGFALGVARQHAAGLARHNTGLAESAARSAVVSTSVAAIGDAAERAESYAREAERWRTYCSDLESRMSALEKQLALANFRVETSGRLLGESDQEISQLRATMAQLEASVRVAREQELRASSALLDGAKQLSETRAELERVQEINAQNEVKLANLSQLVDFLFEKKARLSKALKRESANVYVLNKILDKVVEDIAHVSNPDNFDSLDPEFLLKTVTEEWEEYDATGEMIFKPRIARLPREAQETLFGGPAAPEDDINITFNEAKQLGLLKGP